MKTQCVLLLTVSLACLGCGASPSGWRRETGSHALSIWCSANPVSLEARPASELPPLGGPEPAPNRRFLSRSAPYPSPDGNWLLYWEQELQTGTDTTSPIGERWRLVKRDNGKTQLWPPDGKLSRTPRPSLYMWNQEVLWLPDSSGWSVLHSAEGPAELYRVDTLANGPKLLPLPAKRVDTLLGRRRDGSWLWLPEGSNSVRALRFLATKSPAPAPLTIPGDPTATLRWPYALHTNTDTLAVTVERRNNWWGKFLKQEEITELCVFSLTSGSVSRLPLPDKLAYVRSLQWSPDGKHLLCLLDSQTASNAPIVSKTYLFSQ